MCTCGSSGGQYNPDHVSAVIGGKARVFGIGNPFFTESWPHIPETERMMRRIDAGYTQDRTDCWWGEYEGDKQIERIESSTGPNPNWIAHLQAIAEDRKQMLNEKEDIPKEVLRRRIKRSGKSRATSVRRSRA